MDDIYANTPNNNTTENEGVAESKEEVQNVEETNEPTKQPIDQGQQMEVKEKKVKAKRNLPVANIFIIVSLLIILLIGASVYMLLNKESFPFMQSLIGSVINTKPVPEPTPEPTPEPINQGDDDDDDDNAPKPGPDGNFEYISNNYEFTIKYPEGTTLVEPGSFNTPLETYQIIFAGPNQQEEIVGSENLADGYIVTITYHKDVINTDVAQITLEKRNKFLIDCPNTATISKIADRTISNNTAKTFRVDNCGVNYILSFFIRDNDLFEFNQIYKGDLGIRQVYETKTNEIVALFRLINTIQPTPINTWKTYEDGRNYTFKYPAELNSTCCTIKGPLGETRDPDKLIVLADPKTLVGSGSSQYNGFGVFEIRTNLSAEEYVANQKRLLEENYKIVVGRNPITSEEVITLNGNTFYILRDYAWWGDFAITETQNNGTTRTLLVFVKTELDDNAFEDIFMDILDTLEVTNRNL